MKSIDIRVVIDLVGLVQGLILGSILIIINRHKKKSSFFLGLFVLAFCLDFLPPLLDYLELTTRYPRLRFLPLRLSDFLFPLMYLYVQEISIISDRKKSYWVLWPAIFVNLTFSILFLLPNDLRNFALRYFNWFIGLKIASEVFGLIIGFIIIKTINTHIKILKDQYTNITYKTLKWVKIYSIIGIAFTMIVPILNQIFDDYYYALIICTLNGILLYWVSIKGILQNDVMPLVIEYDAPQKNVLLKHEKEPIKDPLEFEALAKTIDELIKTQKFYKRSDLTIIDVAEALKMHPKLVSTVINTVFNQNFNTFINHYRINEAIQLIQRGDTPNYSIDGIGTEVGFKSKSSFYGAFKQITGTTPSQYKKNIHSA